jgi:sigma-E factor negative regulatory protein RseA
MTNANKNASIGHTTSEIFDGEVELSKHVLEELEHDKFVRYAMIGDVMRSKQESTLTIDITASVAAALDNEPTYAMSPNTVSGADIRDNKAVNDSPSAANNVVSIGRYRKPLAQFAIAASVCLIALVGVNNNVQQGEATNTLPALQSMPLTGGISPVSLSTEQPALENVSQGLRELQQQRIGALVLEHQRQSRMAYALQQAKQQQVDEKPNEIIEDNN